MTPSTLYLIKSNLFAINYIYAIVSFFFGISPLWAKREELLKYHTPFWVEIGAISFLLFNIFMFSLQKVSYKPIFDKNDCIVLKMKYADNLEFSKFYRLQPIKILDLGDYNYFVQKVETKELSELIIQDDYMYKRIKCQN